MNTYADSGASIQGVFNKKGLVEDPQAVRDVCSVVLADSNCMKLALWGEATISFGNAFIHRRNVLGLPSLTHKLVSTGRLANNGFELWYRSAYVVMELDNIGTVVGRGRRDPHRTCTCYRALSQTVLLSLQHCEVPYRQIYCTGILPTWSIRTSLTFTNLQMIFQKFRL